MKHYFGVAREMGVSDDELGALEANVMLVAAGRVSAGARSASIEAKKEAREKRKKEG
jgi:hypothetical protein